MSSEEGTENRVYCSYCGLEKYVGRYQAGDDCPGCQTGMFRNVEHRPTQGGRK